MSTITGDLHLLVDHAVAKAQRLNHAAVHRLIGLLDLEPPLKLEAIHAAVEEELADQRTRARAALAPFLETEVEGGTAAHAADEVLARATHGLPLEALARIRAGSASGTAAVLTEILERHERFARRLSWLLRPSDFAEIQTLDPKRDCNQIYHYISYEFRLEQKLFAVLFELAPVVVPYAALMFASTGEFELRAFRRINDTVMFFSNMIEWGLDSKRGRSAVARVNAIHGRYSLPNELFRFILSGIMFLPVHWNERLGWRRFTNVERLGWFYTFVEMGRAMHIQGITDDYEEMHERWREMMGRAGESTDVAHKAFHQVVIQVLATYPAPLRQPLLAAILCGMPDAYREAMDIPPPPADVVEQVRSALLLIGGATATLPRVPWIRSLQLHPLYRSVEEIGVSSRSAFLPLRARDDARDPEERRRENDGYPTEQRPVLYAAALPDQGLPEITMAEVARHASDEDAWLVVHGYVYDVTRFLHDHPGGRQVLARHLGKDATAAFDKVGHSHGAIVMMSNFRIGRLAGIAVRDFADPARPGGRIHTGRRVGRGKTYTRDDWDRLLDYFAEQTSRYEQAKLVPGRNPNAFPLVLPVDPRSKTDMSRA